MSSNIIVGGEEQLKVFLTGDTVKERLSQVCGQYMTPEKIVRSAIASAVKTPKLYDCTKISWAIALMQAGIIGLEVGPPFNHACFIPYKDSKNNCINCTFQPMYQGLIYLAMDSGIVTYVDARTVYNDDDFEFEYGSSPFIRHRVALNGKVRSNDDIKCFYSVIKTKGSDTPLIKVMSKAEVDAIRARAKGGDSSFSPWNSDYADMGQKTVYKKNQKYAPIAQTRRLTTALQFDDSAQLGIQPSEAEVKQIGTEGKLLADYTSEDFPE